METLACASTSLCFEAYNVNKLRKSRLLKKTAGCEHYTKKAEIKDIYEGPYTHHCPCPILRGSNKQSRIFRLDYIIIAGISVKIQMEKYEFES